MVSNTIEAPLRRKYFYSDRQQLQSKTYMYKKFTATGSGCKAEHNKNKKLTISALETRGLELILELKRALWSQKYLNLNS